MKNDYTPREYAHTLAIDALHQAHTNKFGELDGLTSSEVEATKRQLSALIVRLADEAKLDITPPRN